MSLLPNGRVEAQGRVNTKIVATLGPSSWAPEQVRNLLLAGVDLFRLNFSHGTHEQHARNWEIIRDESRKVDRPVGILQDLSGPKLRIGLIAGGIVECLPGAEFRLAPESSGLDPYELTSTYPDIARDLSPGQVILFADGSVAMEVIEVIHDVVRLRVLLGGPLRSNQGLNLPDSAVSLPSMTEKDYEDLRWGTRHGVEYVALSFVRSAEDIHRLRDEMTGLNLRSKIVAKIEKPQAVVHFDEILAATDAVMLARGDLGVELDVARVPAVQKRILEACHRARVPVITATQMLSSMERSNRPTRAEATDVFNAVLDGTDAVMLSGETAIGDFPVEAVATMSRIVAEAEHLMAATDREIPPSSRSGWVSPITEAVVEAASLICRQIEPALVLVETYSGRSALAISKQRIKAPILALASDPVVVGQLALYWGVNPLLYPDLTDQKGALREAIRWAHAREIVQVGDRVVILLGSMPGERRHNALHIHEVKASDLA